VLNTHRNKLFFFSLIAFFFCSKVFGENKVVYIDLNFLMQNSLAGKSLNSQLKNIQEKDFELFQQKEKKLKSDESKILKQQNVLSKTEFDKLIKVLSNDVNTYKKEKRVSLKNLQKKTNKSRLLFISTLEPILAEYSKKENISLIMQKKNILLGKSNLDITKDVLEIMNQKKKKINLN
tara:strand:- start:2080 stop:2613 length:534 start_codon:yes stop_codon:yes gene_type:complete